MDNDKTHDQPDSAHEDTRPGTGDGPPKSGYVVVPHDADGRSPSLQKAASGLRALILHPLTLLLTAVFCVVLVLNWGLTSDAPDRPQTTPNATPVATGTEPTLDSVESIPDAQVVADQAETHSELSEATQDASAAPGLNSVETDDEVFVIQVGVFRDPANAERLRSSLADLDYSAKISVLPTALHAVAIGPFSERSEADEMSRLVADSTGLKPLVISDRP